MRTIADVGDIPGKAPLTDDERRAFADEWAAEAAARPLRQWQAAMAATDAEVPRALEDLFDALAPAQQAAVAPATRDKIAAKKALRAARPT